MEVHKITVNKSDEATLIAEKIIEVKAPDIVLSVPRFSRLAESSANFRLLKREAEALGKILVVESVDEKVIELCRSSGLEHRNPFWSGKEKQISDIISERIGHHKDKAEAQLSVHKIHKSSERLRAVAPEASGHEDRKAARGRPSFRLILISAILVIFGGAIFAGTQILPRANIKIVAARTNWSYSEVVTVDEALSAPDTERGRIPGQSFVLKKNLELTFPASGKKRIEAKARGKIIIYNAHSSEPQPLVATTRFAAPDGKIFRLAEKITIPGAKIVDGKIQPSSITAEVTADKAGEAYNIGPVEHFTIPGFSGSPKFASFYAESRESMTGGFVGESNYPTEDGIKKAKAETANNLESATRNLMLSQLPREFKLIEGASKWKVLKEQTGIEPGSEKFSVFAEGELTMAVFREADLTKMIEDKLKQETGGSFDVKSQKLNYGQVQFGAKEQLSFKMDYESVLAKKIDIALLKNRIAGRSEPDLKAAIFSVASLESARVSLWPFWVRKVPQNQKRIVISID